MRKTLSKILIALLMIGVFLAPLVKPTHAQTNINPNTGLPSDAQVVKYISTDVAGNDMTTSTGAGAADASASAQASIDEYGCSITSWGGCIAELIFELVWTPISWILTKAADVLDFFIAYSISSSAYTNGFIDKAWAAVRDIANIFFIIALLYIALKTILDSNISSQKRLIANVIIFALLINFSLFVTKVVIDTSNILTKVFYAQITPMDKNGAPIPADSEKPKSVSLGLMKNVMNPKVMVPVIQGNLSAFFIVTIITIGMMIYIIIMFMSVAILFVSRVASLWIAMIFAPLAFMSYALPFDIPGFGHRKWWDLLLKNAFLAPIFVFFLYIVILFGGFLKDFPYNNPASGWGNQIMGAIIPLMLVFILLKKAKDLAVEYAGELGQAMTSGAKVLGGIGLAATGAGLAFAGTRFAGGAASRIMGKWGESWKSSGYTTDENGNVVAKKGIGAYLSRRALKATDYSTKASFDFRKTVAADLINKQAGLDMQSPAGMSFLSSKQGGLKAVQAKRAEEIEKDKDLFKTDMNDGQVKAWSQARIDKYNAKVAASGMSEKAYEEKYGPAPKYYSSAQELNADRMAAFKDAMATNTLLGSLAYTAVNKTSGIIDIKNFEKNKDYWDAHKKKAETKSKEKLGKDFNQEEFEKAYGNKDSSVYEGKYNPEIAKEINDARIGFAKMLIGGAATIGLAGIGGAMVVPAMAAYGAREGADLVGAVESSAQKIVAKNIDKEIKDTENKSARVSTAKGRIKTYSATVENAVSILEKRIGRAIENEEKILGRALTDSEKEAKRKDLIEKNSSYAFVDVERDKTTGDIIKVGDDKNVILTKVDKQGLARAIAESNTELENLREQLKTVNRSLQDPTTTEDARKVLEEKKRDLTNLKVDLEMEVNTLRDMNGIQENIASAARDLSSLTGEKVTGGGDDKK